MHRSAWRSMHQTDTDSGCVELGYLLLHEVSERAGFLNLRNELDRQALLGEAHAFRGMPISRDSNESGSPAGRTSPPTSALSASVPIDRTEERSSSMRAKLVGPYPSTTACTADEKSRGVPRSEICLHSIRLRTPPSVLRLMIPIARYGRHQVGSWMRCSVPSAPPSSHLQPEQGNFTSSLSR